MPDRPTLREAKTPNARAGAFPKPLQSEMRLPHFINAPAGAAKALAALTVAVIGTGSVGLNIALHLARLGVRELILVDHRSFKAESIVTHSLFPSAIGKKKATFTGALAKSISPSTRVLVFAGPVQSLPLAALAGVDIVIMATDNLAAEAFTGQACLHLQKKLIHASVHGESLVAQVRFFSHAGPGSPCPVCQFGEAEMQQLTAETQFSCEGFAAETNPVAAPAQPTMSVSFLCSLTAGFAMTQLLRDQLLLGDPVADTMVEYCGYTHQCVTSKLHPRADCPCDHSPFSFTTLGRPLADSSLRELAVAAGYAHAAAWESTSFRIGDFLWIESGRCQCPEPRAVRRFRDADRSIVGRCARCRQPVSAQPFFSHRTVPARLMRALFDQPLRKLGAANARWAVVSHGGQGVLLRDSLPLTRMP